jgi:hypothetical protein
MSGFQSPSASEGPPPHRWRSGSEKQEAPLGKDVSCSDSSRKKARSC